MEDVRAAVSGSTRRSDDKAVLFYDYEEFHGPKGAPAARNFVFLDGHVAPGLGFELEDEEEGQTQTQGTTQSQ